MAGCWACHVKSFYMYRMFDRCNIMLSEPRSSDINRSLYSGALFDKLAMELGDLEAAVLGSVLRLNRASARQVVKDLEPSRGLAYSTISTTLDRLYKKGVLGRDEEVGRGGSRYIYMIRSEEKVKGSVVKGVVDRLLAAFGPSVLSTLNDYVDEIPKEQLKRLEDKIQRGTKR